MQLFSVAAAFNCLVKVQKCLLVQLCIAAVQAQRRLKKVTKR